MFQMDSYRSMLAMKIIQFEKIFCIFHLACFCKKSQKLIKTVIT